MKYIEEAIDIGSEYGMKYLELVSRGDYGDNLEVHHIVPVAYFADVLGIKECRTSKSPDMEPDNLVSLSKGRHVLAHFYLAKCAKPCIAVQMRNAFCLTYQTTDFSKITEEEVIARMAEINSEYGRMKSRKKEHKDGIEIRRTKTSVSMNRWEGGKPVGISMKWGADGKIREVNDHESGLTVQSYSVGTELRLRMHAKIGNYDRKQIFEIIDGFSISAGCGNTSIIVYTHLPYRGFTGLLQWRDGSYKEIEGENEFWEQVKDFLSKKGRECLSSIILSIRRYASMVNMGMSKKTNHLLYLMESCAVDAVRLPALELPEFPGATKPKKSKDGNMKEAA